jgi:hypothetical protein
MPSLGAHCLSGIEVLDSRDRTVDTQMRDSMIVFHTRNMLRVGLPSAEILMCTTLWSAGVSQCQLPVDRVRGLPRFSHDPDEIGITAENWSDVVTVYTKFSRYLLGSADVCWLGHSSDWWAWLDLAFTLVRHADLPSWVPDLHQQDDIRHGRRWYDNFIKVDGSFPHRASTKENKGAVLGTRLDELILRGKKLDEVLVVYPEIPLPMKGARDDVVLSDRCRRTHWEEELANAVLSGKGPIDQKPHQLISLDTYWKTLVSGKQDYDDSGHLTVESYQKYHNTARRKKEIAERHNVTDRYGKFSFILYLNGQMLMQAAGSPWVLHGPTWGSQRKKRRS